MRPSFSPLEEFFIASYRLQHQRGGRNTDVRGLCYLVSVAALAALGLYKDDVTWILIGLAIAGIRLGQNMIASAKYNPVIASIISKYDSAVISAAKPVQSPLDTIQS